MSSCISPHSSPAHPTSRGSGFSQRIVSKVLLLIEKFESLTRAHPPDQAPQFQQPSYTAARTSTLRRLGTSVLKRASLFAEQRTGPQLEKTQPPKRRFLKISRNRAKNQASKQDNENEQTKSHRSSNGFDCDGPVSTLDSNSTLVETDTSSTSTPPVARILPSSFFDQLLPSNEPTPIRSKFNPRNGWGRKKKVMQLSKSIQDLRGNVGQKEYTFVNIKRKPVPSSLSVEDLTQRFREVERANAIGCLGSKEGEALLEGVTRRELDPKKDQNSSRSLLHGQSSLKEADNSFGILIDDEATNTVKKSYGDDWFYGDSFYDTPVEEDSTCTPELSPLVYRDRRYLSTNLQYMPDGTFSNFGYFMSRLESEADTPGSESEIETPDTDAFKIATQADPPTAKTVKVYRKTPPPLSFFNPENRRISSGSNMEKRFEGDFAVKRSPKRPEIISPVPLNAVQSAELRGMVFRYT